MYIRQSEHPWCPDFKIPGLKYTFTILPDSSNLYDGLSIFGMPMVVGTYSFTTGSLFQQFSLDFIYLPGIDSPGFVFFPPPIPYTNSIIVYGITAYWVINVIE